MKVFGLTGRVFNLPCIILELTPDIQHPSVIRITAPNNSSHQITFCKLCQTSKELSIIQRKTSAIKIITHRN